ncbi:MAG: M3 family oligoendopeptidase [Opitutaceae bacterium]
MDWDLSSYFPSFDGPKYRQFRDRLNEDLRILNRAFPPEIPGTDPDLDPLIERILGLEDASVRRSHLSSYLGCLTAADSAHEGYAAEEAALALTGAAIDNARTLILARMRLLDTSGLQKLIGDPRLADAGYALTRLHQAASRRMSETEEALASDLGVDGFEAWGRLYDNLAGNLEFEMARPDGTRERLPMSQRRSLLGHPDRRIRRAAFDGGNHAWDQVARVAASALNSLAGTRQTLRIRRGQEHFLDPALFDARISPPCLDALFQALKSRRESAWNMLRFRAGLMGLERIAWFDLEAPIPSPDKDAVDLSWPAACAWVQDAFDRSYPALGTFFRAVVEKQWIDWQPRRGKRPGGFCTSSNLSGESRIFMTYNQTVNDVMTLAHEAGHAFHSHLLADKRGLIRSYPMTLAETASTFAEQILIEGILSDPSAPVGRKRQVLDSQVRHAVTFLLDIPIRYHFERRFHEERQTGEVGVGRLKTLMTETQQEWLGDTLEPGGEDPLFWASKLHFFITGLSFYNFPYTFGFLLSRKLYARLMAEGPSFLPHYEAFLRQTTVQDADALIRNALGEDPADPAFWAAAIDSLQEPFESLRSLDG